MPMDGWGLMHLVGAVLLALACWQARHVQAALVVNALFACFWGFLLLVSAAETHVTFTNGLLWLTVALCHFGLAFALPTPQREADP